MPSPEDQEKKRRQMMEDARRRAEAIQHLQALNGAPVRSVGGGPMETPAAEPTEKPAKKKRKSPTQQAFEDLLDEIRGLRKEVSAMSPRQDAPKIDGEPARQPAAVDATPAQAAPPPSEVSSPAAMSLPEPEPATAETPSSPPITRDDPGYLISFDPESKARDTWPPPSAFDDADALPESNPEILPQRVPEANESPAMGADAPVPVSRAAVELPPEAALLPTPTIEPMSQEDLAGLVLPPVDDAPIQSPPMATGSGRYDGPIDREAVEAGALPAVARRTDLTHEEKMEFAAKRSGTTPPISAPDAPAPDPVPMDPEKAPNPIPADAPVVGVRQPVPVKLDPLPFGFTPVAGAERVERQPEGRIDPGAGMFRDGLDAEINTVEGASETFSEAETLLQSMVALFRNLTTAIVSAKREIDDLTDRVDADMNHDDFGGTL